MANYEEFLERIKATVNGRVFNSITDTRVPSFKFAFVKDGYKINQHHLSIQASEYHYCLPRENVKEYTHVEIGFPSFEFSEAFINKYADDPMEPCDTVYGYVPIEELALEIYDFCKKEMKRLIN